MEEQIITATSLVPFNAIRVETVLSRFPVHRLATKGDVAIELHETNDTGATTLSWKVDYSATYGQPGPLAYKLDTLIINRRIEEARPRVPKLLRLGSLSDICKELGLADSGKNRADIKKALLQNAFAGIVPQISFNLADGSENTLDTAFNRYSVIFTGKKLPNGQKANAVYIVLNDVFLQVINGATTRPLDYEYLKSLPPVSQRFYEILSYRMYGTLKHERARVKLVYSELCAYAPQKRHKQKKHVFYQMRQVYKKHLESGYIMEVNYQEITDEKGDADWVMLYKPGPKARAEFRAFEKRGGPNILEVEPFDPYATGLVLEQLPLPEAMSPLVAALDQRGLSGKTIAEILSHTSEATIQAQLECFDWLVERQDKRVAKSPAGYLARAILENWKLPKDFVPLAERQRQQEAKQARERATAEDRRRKQDADARDRREKELVNGFWDGLNPDQKAEHDAAALALAGPDDLTLINGSMKKFGMTVIRNSYARRLLQSQGKLPTADA
jgi:hypothetical protein